ncbi:MAG: mannosyltransferase family protein, partial [Pyrinomonadaceae bacterium]
MKAVRRHQNPKLSVVASRGRRVAETFRRLDWSLVALILLIKALLILFAAQAFHVTMNRHLGTFHGWLEIWNRWDASHYLDLARDGYAATGEQRFRLVFYPLYPWAVRLFSFITGGDYLVGAFIVSGLASIAAGLLLHRLASLDEEESVARGAVWFLFIFPTSYFLHIGYTESLFLALALGCFLAARNDRWLMAGVLGALAGLGRVNGLVLIPALAVEIIQQYREKGEFDRRWLWAALSGCGFAGYLLLNKHVTGDFFAFLKISREHWQKSLEWPWVGIGATIKSIWWRAPADAQMVGVQELIFIALGLAGTVWCWRAMRPSYGVWMTGNWLLWTGTSFILSAPRYTLIMFPLCVMFARLAARRPLWGHVVTAWSLLF